MGKRHGKQSVGHKANRPERPAWVKLVCYALFAVLLVTAGLIVQGFERRPPEQPAPSAPHIDVDVDEGVSAGIRIEVLTPSEPPAMDLSGPAPKILIYHTHATEAYTIADGDVYEESGSWRTKDKNKSIVAVGALLAKTLRETYGFSVLHDTTNHEPPKLSTAYSRSVTTMEKYRKEYPSLLLYIDVHRDAGGDNTAVEIDGVKTARLMFVVGTGEGATGAGFGEMPDFESNYALAAAVSSRLAAVDKRLIRNIRVKTGRYNQHISNACLLVEVGDNANTLREAKNAVPHLAKAIAEVAKRGTEAFMPQKSDAPTLLWAPV